ncbi:hypothetical protein ONS96_013858 [Cadophora gregata f. sp. sojae]|nr:hypothetical protein ONS96_013858 [Cadophora gregata f. sp. sojae]
MEKWKRLPLSTPEDVQNWWVALRAENGITDQIEEHQDILDMKDKEMPQATTPGQMSYRSESGVAEDTNMNLVPIDGLHSRTSTEQLRDPQMAGQDTSRIEPMSYGGYDTAHHNVSDRSWDANTISQGQGQMSSNQQNNGGGSEEENRPQKLASMMSHLYY